MSGVFFLYKIQLPSKHQAGGNGKDDLPCYWEQFKGKYVEKVFVSKF